MFFIYLGLQTTPNLDRAIDMAKNLSELNLRELDAVHLVARSVHTDSKLDKDWVWLSDFDKDVIMIKKNSSRFITLLVIRLA